MAPPKSSVYRKDRRPHPNSPRFVCSPPPSPKISVLKVSTPLALNIYTAVHNPISVKGRIQLCRGALAHVDTRPVLSEIDVPVICIQSTQNNFVKPLHTDPYVTRRGGEVRSIHKVTPWTTTMMCFVLLRKAYPSSSRSYRRLSGDLPFIESGGVASRVVAEHRRL